MTRFRLPAAAILTGLAALPAFAGSLEQPIIEEPPTIVPAAPPTPARFDWTGPSVGGQLSFGDVQTEGPDLDGDGAFYGLRAYYDYDFGNFIVGGGLQYDAADIDLDGVAAINSVLRLGARFGAGSGQNWYYGTAGYALADTDAGTADPGSSSGYFVGAGYEVALTETFTLGAELLYHQFDDFDIGALEADATTLGLSANYRF